MKRFFLVAILPMVLLRVAMLPSSCFAMEASSSNIRMNTTSWFVKVIDLIQATYQEDDNFYKKVDVMTEIASKSPKNLIFMYDFISRLNDEQKTSLKEIIKEYETRELRRTHDWFKQLEELIGTVGNLYDMSIKELSELGLESPYNLILTGEAFWDRLNFNQMNYFIEILTSYSKAHSEELIKEFITVILKPEQSISIVPLLKNKNLSELKMYLKNELNDQQKKWLDYSIELLEYEEQTVELLFSLWWTPLSRLKK